MRVVVTDAMEERLNRRLADGVPLDAAERALWAALQKEAERGELSSNARRALHALEARVRLAEPRPAPAPRPAAPSAPMPSVEGAAQRVARLKHALDEKTYVAAARESMFRLLVVGGAPAAAAVYNVQGCCGSCMHREACFGARGVQLAHCLQVSGGEAQMRCLEHQERVRLGRAPADVCGGPGVCAMYKNAAADADVHLGVGR